MKKMKRLVSIILVMCTLASSVLLFGCGSTKRGKTEKEIMKDVAETDSFFIEFNLSPKKISITKRQTNVEDKTDYIWATIEAENDEFVYHADFEMTYILYNEGWMLETLEQTDEGYNYVGKHPESVQESDAWNQGIYWLRYLGENGFKYNVEPQIVELVERIESDNRVKFVFKITEVSIINLNLKTDTLYISYHYTPRGSWSFFSPDSGFDYK